MSTRNPGHRLAVVLAAFLTLAAGSARANTFTVNSLLDTADAIPGNGSCATAGGVCTLRAAIQEANALAAGAPHTINFSVSGTIQVNSSGLGALPTITRAMTINGGGTPSSSATPYTTNASFVVVLDGKTFNAAGDGLRVDLGQAVPPVHPASAAAAVTIKGLVIGGFSGAGIQLVTGYNTVQGCFIGTNQTGTAATASTANGTGVTITATAGNNAADGHNLVGGAGSPAFTNLISGNTTDGVDISGQSAFNMVQANVIGTDKTGTTAVPNGDNGIYISGDSQNNQIGGPSAPAGSFAGNLISGNDTTGTGAGVQIVGPNSTGNSVYGNRIGTNAAGTAAIPNGAIVPPVTGTNGGDGVQIAGGANLNTIGSVTNNQGNLISGNFGNGIALLSGDNNVIEANIVGANAAATAKIGNHCDGILVASNGNRIGNFVSVGQGNVIGGSLGDTGCGTGASGGPGAGIHIRTGANNTMYQNGIGIEPLGVVNLGNAFAGIWITGGSATGNKIGNGTSAGANSIDYNGQLGISLGDGITPTPNEVSLFSGPNNYQNYPVLTSVVSTAGQTTIQGTYDFPNGIQTYTLEFFSSPAADPSGFGEGAQWEGTTNVLTDASGHATFSKIVTPAILAGRKVTALAIDANGNTSEFSGDFTPTPVELQRFEAE